MLKKYKPSKWLSYLYFIFPLFLVTKINIGKESDIWFLLSYGKKIVTSGFPKYDFLSMHENFSFVMQQWLSALSFYQVYKLLGGVGLFLLVFIIQFYSIFLSRVIKFFTASCGSSLLYNTSYTALTIGISILFIFPS